MDTFKTVIKTGIAVGVAGFVYALAIRPWQLRRDATNADVRRALPGDELVPNPKCGYTQEITINASAAEVWPWLVQIGYKRADWYSHDFLHRLVGIAGSVGDARGSAKRIIPELQDLQVGDTVDIAPGIGYIVAEIEPERVLILHGRVATDTWQSVPSSEPLPEKGYKSSWVWVLEEIDEKTTRLIVRVRSDYNPEPLTTLVMRIANEVGRLLMQPKTLRVLKQRAEIFDTLQDGLQRVPIEPRHVRL